VIVGARSGPRSLGSGVVWLALAAASLAVVNDLLTHWWADPWARYSLLFAPLALWVASRGASGEPRPHAAYWVGLGAAFEVLAVGGGFERFGRLGLATALVGMTGLHGVRSWSRRLCPLWIVPVPAQLCGWLDPTPLWGTPGPGLELTRFDGGLPVVAVLAGLGWHASAVADASLRTALWRALRWGLLGIPIQAAALALAGAALLLAPAPVVRSALDAGPWLLGAALGLLLLLRSSRYAPPVVAHTGVAGAASDGAGPGP
jgi:hypothetical protein